MLGYVIGGVLSQLTSNQVILDRTIGSNVDWYQVTYFSRKTIPAETCYETYDDELLAIVEVFKTRQHYLKGCKYKVLVFTNHNNFSPFMDTKSLSSRQVCWAQELVTTSKSITVRARQTELPMPYHNTFREVLRKKILSTLKTSRYCTAYSSRWPEYLVFWLTQVNSPLSTRCW